MIDLTQENIQKIFVHMINCHEVKYNVKDWSKIYKTVCNQKLSIQEVHKIAQHISPVSYTHLTLPTSYAV